MATVDLYLDPVCPFSWVTSRWLLDAADERQTPVTLRQMSLAVLNEGKELEGKQKRMMERSRRLGRLFSAVVDKHGQEAFARLYDALGTQIHVRDDELTTGEVRELLSKCGLEGSLCDALEDSRFDDEVRRTHEAAQQALGGPAGSPIIVIDGRAFHGPVLNRIPTHADGVRLLDAILVAAHTPEFHTLQRPNQGPPVLEEAAR
ncbi:mycothiol-dependent nitroreductase Rv2466c family protein [Mycobacterium sp. Marseille-P9652]|uniref:mycothiol-dependent nitroreductase Rv2466c family protein n=1 Tax=Mycobacterium sp. Marseille-P9652 TaxID=2654950 RepID=UPI0012E85707|nr:DsbA family protein [Mycobacterium sp. Marseille-P9652]